MWNLMIVDALPRRPLILIGRGWQAMLDQAYSELSEYFVENQRSLLQFVPNVQSAVTLLEQQS